MYQDFGAREVDDTGRVRFRLFVPDNELDPTQYQRGQLPRIARAHVIGDFQAALGKPNWVPDPRFDMQKSRFTDPEDGKTKGWLYELTTGPLPDGFYQYKLHVTYESGSTRVVCDPCTRYGGATDQNSGVTVGGPKMDTVPLADPQPIQELVLYELMIDDFTKLIRGNHAPLAVVREKLDHLERLGVTAIQFMPWTEWPGQAYNWGYEPQGYFAVAFPYTLNPAQPSEKLFLLKRLISDCHERGIHVLFDGVFDHVTDAGPHLGFGYRWLWENPDDSPYMGDFAGVGYGKDLDYRNGCTLEFIFDVCRYWIDEFAIDGIRFDYTAGFYDPQRHGERGLPALVQRLRRRLDAQGRTAFPLILEHEWTYSSIDVVNKVGASSCWLDPFRGASRGYLTGRRVRPGVMRTLDSARDFAAGRTPVTYIENHDHESFMLNAGSRDQWWRTQPYAIALFTAAGAPMIHNGQEFAELYPMPESDSEVPSGCLDPARKRVVPRPLQWGQLDDGCGRPMCELYRKLIKIRRQHLGLTSPHFHPGACDEGRAGLDEDGFGIDEARQIVVYHRWGTASDGHLEKFYIVLNFSQWPQTVEMTFPEDDGWIDLLSGWQPSVKHNRLRFEVGSNWGHIFYKKAAGSRNQ
ncbi:MAG: alpha-amylase family glycosyl hydrolase [Thermodesulfobacteriota bacterium]